MPAGERLRMPLVRSRAAWLERLCAPTPGDGLIAVARSQTASA
jgi:hypothetical protein